MALQYNGNLLQTASILTQAIDHTSAPDATVSMFAIAHGNRSSITNNEYQSKKITLSGVLIGTSLTNIEALIDTFKGYMVGSDNPLDIDYNGSTRRYTATPVTVSIDRPGGLLYATFQVVFSCSSPFGIGTSATTLISTTGNTTASSSIGVTFAGNAPYQVPIITVTFSAVAMAGFSTRTVSIGNNATGQQLNITRFWNGTDVLAIDTGAKSVTVNGTPTDYTGAFPEFGTGSQAITYSDNLGSRTYAFLATCVPRYL